MPSLFKQITVILLLSAFLAHTIGNGFYVADYYLNPGKYAKNCINKAKPKLKCNGKCQLMKKIQAGEQREKENGAKQFAGRMNITIINKNYFVIIDDVLLTNDPLQPVYRNTIETANYIASVFHPPC